MGFRFKLGACLRLGGRSEHRWILVCILAFFIIVQEAQDLSRLVPYIPNTTSSTLNIPVLQLKPVTSQHLVYGDSVLSNLLKRQAWQQAAW